MLLGRASGTLTGVPLVLLTLFAASWLTACAPWFERPLGSRSRAPLAGAESTPRAPCLPRFPFEQGWLGGDAVYSVSTAPLSRDPHAAARGPRPTLWLFGDSFVSGTHASDRREAQLVHNTVGRSRCTSDGRFEIEYGWRAGTDGRPRAIFDTGSSDRYAWPLGGFVHEDRLYVTLLIVAPRPGAEPPFEPIGVDLARVANPMADPGSWTIDRAPLARNPRGFPAGAVWLEAGYVHFYGFLQPDRHSRPRFVARLPLSALAEFGPSLAASLETFVRDDRWSAGFVPERAKILMADDATEMSIARDPDGRRLRAVYSFPYQGAEGLAGPGSEVVYTRTAERPEGPWSDPKALLLIPDLRSDFVEGHDPAMRCYAAKAHPGFGTADRIVLTYVCNLFALGGEHDASVLERLVDRPQVYRPRVVSWPRPPGSGPAANGRTHVSVD